MTSRTYIAIDLKSFYASVECVDRGLDPLTTNLVVADASRTQKTICLAVSPSLKSYGIPGRARLFEVIEKVKLANAKRQIAVPKHRFLGKTCSAIELEKNFELAIDFVTATPRMARYMEVSNKIYNIYLNYIAPEDIHNYSIDEVFIDVTSYLGLYKLTARQFALKLIQEVFKQTGITATVGIGNNLYLCKVAMDIVAKHMPTEENGGRIAELNELSYREQLWSHRPLTDFWRVGKGYAKKLEKYALYTMGDIARCSLGKLHEYYNEDLLYKLFGVNAELLIDHAWGYEPCTIKDIKSYKPSAKSVGAEQVLAEGYSYDKGLLVAREMTDLLSLELVKKNLVTSQLTLTVVYDVENLSVKNYHGAVVQDTYGRMMPKPAHGTGNLSFFTSSTKELLKAINNLYEEIVDKNLLVRKIYITASKVDSYLYAKSRTNYEQLDLFSSSMAIEHDKQEKTNNLEKEKNCQNAILSIKNKFGKNAILKGMNLKKGATTRSRNEQIGGHKS